MSTSNPIKVNLIAISIVAMIILLPIVGCSNDAKPDTSDIKPILVEKLNSWVGNSSTLTVESVKEINGVNLDYFGQEVYEISYTATVRANDWVSKKHVGTYRPGELKELSGNIAFGKTDNGWELVNFSDFLFKTLEVQTPKEIQVATKKLNDSLIGRWSEENNWYEFSRSGDYTQGSTRSSVLSSGNSKGKWQIDDYGLVMTFSARGAYSQTKELSSVLYVVSFDDATGKLVTKAQNTGREHLWTKMRGEIKTATSPVLKQSTSKEPSATGDWFANFTLTGVDNAPKLYGVISFDSSLVELLAEAPGGKTRRRTVQINKLSKTSDKVNFEASYNVNGRKETVNYSVVINGNNMTGEWNDSQVSGRLEAQRVSLSSLNSQVKPALSDVSARIKIAIGDFYNVNGHFALSLESMGLKEGPWGEYIEKVELHELGNKFRVIFNDSAGDQLRDRQIVFSVTVDGNSQSWRCYTDIKIPLPRLRACSKLE